MHAHNVGHAETNEVKERKMFNIQLVVAFASIFAGVLLRTLLPSIKKLQAGQKWDSTYTATAGFAILTSFVTAVLAFPTFNFPADPTGLFSIFVISFPFGWGLNDFYNKIFADLQDTTTPTTTTPAPSTPTLVTDTTQLSVGAYNGWTIKIVNGRLMLYPPANLTADLGTVMSPGSVVGYDSTFDFLGMAKKQIDAMIAAMQSPNYHTGSPGPLPQPIAGT